MGFNFKYSLEEMFVESIETCRQKGFLPVSLPSQSISENKVLTKDDNTGLIKPAVGLTDGIMPCNKTEPGVTSERTDVPMPAQQMCA